MTSKVSHHQRELSLSLNNFVSAHAEIFAEKFSVASFFSNNFRWCYCIFCKSSWTARHQRVILIGFRKRRPRAFQLNLQQYFRNFSRLPVDIFSFCSELKWMCHFSGIEIKLHWAKEASSTVCAWFSRLICDLSDLCAGTRRRPFLVEIFSRYLVPCKTNKGLIT